MGANMYLAIGRPGDRSDDKAAPGANGRQVAYVHESAAAARRDIWKSRVKHAFVSRIRSAGTC